MMYMVGQHSVFFSRETKETRQYTAYPDFSVLHTDGFSLHHGKGAASPKKKEIDMDLPQLTWKTQNPTKEHKLWKILGMYYLGMVLGLGGLVVVTW